MRLEVMVAVLLATPAVEEKCKPAAADIVAAAERRAADADASAAQAESIAVRSGNPGAQARADQARADATAAHDKVARLRCLPVEARRPAPLPKMPGRGY
jgi:hypothetical protein